MSTTTYVVRRNEQYQYFFVEKSTLSGAVTDLSSGRQHDLHVAVMRLGKCHNAIGCLDDRCWPWYNRLQPAYIAALEMPGRHAPRISSPTVH